MKPQTEQFINKHFGKFIWGWVLICLIIGLLLISSCSTKHLTATKTVTNTDSTTQTNIADKTKTHIQEWADYTAWSAADTVSTELEPDTAGNAYIETGGQYIHVEQMAGNRRLKITAIAKPQPVAVKVNKTTDIAEDKSTAVKSHVIAAQTVKERIKDKKPDVLGNASTVLIVLFVLIALFLVIRWWIKKQY